jgi:hypothetical protein
MAQAEGQTEGATSVTDSRTTARPERIANFPTYTGPAYHIACPSGQAPYDHLPPVAQYACRRTTKPITMDGRLDESVWQQVEWSQRFVDEAI